MRRLEALRRAGIVERLDADHWEIPKDFLEQAAAYDKQHGRKLLVEVHSVVELDRQIGRLLHPLRRRRGLDADRVNPDRPVRAEPENNDTGILESVIVEASLLRAGLCGRPPRRGDQECPALRPRDDVASSLACGPELRVEWSIVPTAPPTEQVPRIFAGMLRRRRLRTSANNGNDVQAIVSIVLY